jgi:hypothetical protein
MEDALLAPPVAGSTQPVREPGLNAPGANPTAPQNAGR